MQLNKLQVLLSVRDGVVLDEAREAIARDVEDAWRRESGSGVVYRQLCAVTDDYCHHLTDRYPHFGERSPHFDTIVEIESAGLPVGEIGRPLAGIATRLEAWIEPARTAAIAGVEHVIVPGTGPLVLVYPLRRVAQLSHDGFAERWLKGHVEVASEAGNLGKFRYRQFHADPAATIAAARSLRVGLDDFEGAAIGFYDTSDEFIQVAVDPNMRIEDELHFIDHARSTLAMYEIRPLTEA